jgi:hypothetical protein
MKVIEVRDTEKRPKSSKGGIENDNQIKSRNSSSKARGIPKNLNLYTNDSLDSSFLNKLVYDYKANLDTAKQSIDEGRISRKSSKSLKMEEKENARSSGDENENKRKSLMKVLTLSKSSSMTSLKERASFLESSNPTPPSDSQTRKSDIKSTRSGSQSPLFGQAQSYATSVRIKTSENLSDIDQDDSKSGRKKLNNYKAFKQKQKPEIKRKQIKIRSNINESTYADNSKPKKVISNEDYYRSIMRLSKSGRKTQEQSPTRFKTVHDSLILDSNKILELTKRLSKSKIYLMIEILRGSTFISKDFIFHNLIKKFKF